MNKRFQRSDAENVLNISQILTASIRLYWVECYYDAGTIYARAFQLVSRIHDDAIRDRAQKLCKGFFGAMLVATAHENEKSRKMGVRYYDEYS